MTESTALVGPLQLLRFGTWRNQVRIPYAVPRNTLDPRFALCFDHHTACDCREAELNETINEYRYGMRAFTDAAQKLLVGHRVYDYQEDVRARAGSAEWMRYINGDGPLACQCTGCQLVRASHEHIDTDEYGVVS